MPPTACWPEFIPTSVNNGTIAYGSVAHWAPQSMAPCSVKAPAWPHRRWLYPWRGVDHSVRRLNSQRALSTYVLTSLWLLDGRNGEKTEVGESILVALPQALFIQANVGQSSESWKSQMRQNCALGWSVTPGLGCTCVRGGGPWVLWMDNKALAILTMSIDPFMQGSQCTPQILASGEIRFF